MEERYDQSFELLLAAGETDFYVQIHANLEGFGNHVRLSTEFPEGPCLIIKTHIPELRDSS